MTETVVFLNEYSSRIQRRIDAMRPFEDRVVFLTMDSITYLSLRQRGYPVRFAHDSMTHAEAKHLEVSYMEAIHSAYVDPEHPNKRDFSVYEGTLLGYFSEFYMFPTMRATMAYILATRKCIEEFRPKRIIVIGEDEFPRAVRMVLDQKAIAYESWDSGRLRRAGRVISKFIKGISYQWINTPTRYILFETIQLMIVLFLYGILPQGSRKKIGDRKVLIIPADINFLPIMKNLLASGDWDFCVFGLHFRLRGSHFPNTIPLEQGLHISLLPRFLRAAGYYMLQWFRMKKHPEFVGKFRFLDINYWQAISPVIKWDLFVTFPKLYLYHLVLSRSLARMPKGSLVLVTSNEHPIDRLVVDAAKKYGVLSIGTQHGVYTGDWLGRGLVSDYFASWGDSVRDFYFGTDEKIENIFVTGSPRYDEVYRKSRLYNKKEILSMLGLPEGKTLILIATVWGEIADGDDDICAIDLVVDAIKTLGLEDKCHVVIKPHPTANHKILRMVYEEKLAIFPHISYIQGHMEELLFISDICVGQYTTAIMEAMFFGKPSILCDRYAKNPTVAFASKGTVLEANTPQDMALALKLLLFDEPTIKRIKASHAAFIRYGTYKFDDRSTERFCNAVEMISQGKTPPVYLD